ncbi:MAG: flavin-dependent dehydrogenase [Planctomycetota bacterium]|jgi:flavin-dependent dehydrogenase
MSDQPSPSTQDVVICGGGLAGLLLARHLRRELPDLSVTVIDRMARPLPAAAHKVGESSVELGCQYLESLGLTDYLLEQHLVKFGLRFFPGGGKLPLAERTEIGPCAEPRVRSFQMDRGKIENDLREMNDADGVTMIEGAKVTDIDLTTDGSDHRVAWAGNDAIGLAAGEVKARWVVDATGRQALLRKRMKTTRGSPHKAHAGWFRVKGKVDLEDMVPASNTEWHEREGSKDRWRSTNHFMGVGYWAWLIPLSTGRTSVGLVIHEESHDFTNIAGLDKCMAFLREHEPHLAALIEPYEVEDFLCLKGYSHNVSRCWSADRWALVGEAGAFVDPLYSPGTDFIATANKYTVEMISTDYALKSGELKPGINESLGFETLATKANHLNVLYRSMWGGCIDLFRRAAPVYAHPSAMGAKVFIDNFLYWSFTCHLVHQGVYRMSAAGYAPYGKIGVRFLELGNFMQGFFREWALLAPEEQKPVFLGAPHFPSILVDAHVATGERWTLEKTLEYMQMRAPQAEDAVGEMVLRVVQQLGPDLGAQLLEKADFKSLGMQISAHRLEGETKIGKARRAHMSHMHRDVERTLGRIVYHPEAARARELLASFSVV